jgi:hypothetical protein
MARGVVVLVALAVVALSATTAGSSTALPPGYSVAARANLYSGVDYVKLAKAKSPAVAAHVARVAPGAPVDLRVVNAKDKIPASTRELETTSSMCRRVRCVVGVNGDFHKFGTPAGAVIADRRMLHSPDPSRPQLTMTGDGRLVAGPLPWSGSVTGLGSQIAVAAVNDVPPAGGLAVYTPAYGARTEPSARTELVVRAPGGVGLLNQPARLELKGLRSGAGPIPADGVVLSADGVAAEQLQDLWAKHLGAPSSAAQLVVQSTVDAVVSLGAEPVVLRDGRRALPWRDPNLVYPRQPHTLVGWNKAGDIYLVAIDGRQEASDGMTMAEAADFLLDLGVTDAVNLDGGGGTTFVVGGSVWNRPSDNDPARPAEYSERGSANALVVTSRAGAPLPPASPAAPKPLPATPGTPGGAGGGTDPPSIFEDAPSGADSGVFGPVPGVGGALAPGELPLGPSAHNRTAGPGKPVADFDNGPSRAGLPVAPEAVGPTGRADSGGARGTADLAASQLTVGVDEDGQGWMLAGAILLLAVGAAAGGAILQPVIKRRRRRRGVLYY